MSPLAQLGLKNVEVPCPKDDAGKKKLKDALAKYGMNLSCLGVGQTVDLSTEAGAEAVRAVVDTAVEFGVELVFVSCKSTLEAGKVASRSDWTANLRGMADYAQSKGRLLSIETHPDVATNADLFLQLLDDLKDHPAVGWNFDDANLCYYNTDLFKNFGTQGIVKEAERVASRGNIYSLHIKETDGGYESWNFPALGEGAVDFKALIDRIEEIREQTGSRFPLVYTMELEGVKGKMIDQREQFAIVEKSAAHLRSLGFEF